MTSTSGIATMQLAMSTASAVGKPTNAREAGQILDTGSDYLKGTAGAIEQIDASISRRKDQVSELAKTNPAAAAKQEEQIALLDKLRARMQLSMERIGDILAGKDRPDIGDGSDEKASTRGADERQQRELEDEARRVANWRRELVAERVQERRVDAAQAAERYMTGSR